MKKNMTFETAKKFDVAMSANMPVRFGKTSKMVNHLLQNCDNVYLCDPATGLSCLYQKIGRGLAF